ncbi:hypothetical protein KFE98_15415 [bacterium SCSIO 12741]|nr:hypothetical protein KFE98_15415 [bacterium SCSIO 12741]
MPINHKRIRKIIQRVVFFFPLRLVAVHLQRNQVLIIYWVILFGLVTQLFARTYGLPNLLLYPEYLGEVNFLSHILLGLACGSFIMAFNISSYIINGFRFPFIATLSRPFLMYVINNFLIPTTFLFIYMVNMVDFQINRELETPLNVMIHLMGFLLGIFFFAGLSISYFIGTNKSVFAMFEGKGEKRRKRYRPIRDLLEPEVKWYQFLKRTSRWKIETYITEKLRIAVARPTRHYSRETLRKVIQQNHLNASLFEIGAIISILTLGIFMENPVFAIPAGASIFLLLTLALMFTGALHNWLKQWSIFGFLVIFLSLNYLSTYPIFRRTNMAYGLNYDAPPQPYTNESIAKLHGDSLVNQEAWNREIESLNNWKAKNGNTLVLVNTSGGGLRSAVWTYHSLEHCDSVLDGALFSKTRLITGASGGMIGSAYYRENHLRQKFLKEETRSTNGTENMARDILNPLAFAWVVNDFFIRYRTFEADGHRYFKDRGYYFEKQLNLNTEGVLNKPVSSYAPYVYNGDLPEMWFSPIVSNDGRRLVIGSSSVLYLYHNRNRNLSHAKYGTLDFYRLFENQSADKLLLTSALRMNATFPYVLPTISLPSEPAIDVMDAGVRDNYGWQNSVDYLSCMSPWIDTAIEKIVVVRILDKPDQIKINQDPYESLLHSITSPVGSVYQNLFNSQFMAQEEMMALLPHEIKSKVKVVNLVLNVHDERSIPISWHLAKKDVMEIRGGMSDPKNQQALKELKNLLN